MTLRWTRYSRYLGLPINIFFSLQVKLCGCDRILGTPNEVVWPGVTSLQDWNEDFPVWPSLHIAKFTPGLNESGIDLLEVIDLVLFLISI